MSRCEFSGVGPVVKNLVSHSNIKTKSKAFPNVQKRTFYSTTLKRTFRAKVCTRVLRDIDKMGNVEIYLLKQEANRLSPRVLTIRKGLLTRMRKSNKNKQVGSNEAKN